MQLLLIGNEILIYFRELYLWIFYFIGLKNSIIRSRIKQNKKNA